VKVDARGWAVESRFLNSAQNRMDKGFAGPPEPSIRCPFRGPRPLPKLQIWLNQAESGPRSPIIPHEVPCPADPSQPARSSSMASAEGRSPCPNLACSSRTWMVGVPDPGGGVPASPATSACASSLTTGPPLPHPTPVHLEPPGAVL